MLPKVRGVPIPPRQVAKGNLSPAIMGAYRDVNNLQFNEYAEMPPEISKMKSIAKRKMHRSPS